MSGIAGIFLRDKRSVDPDLIKKMNQSIAHRGPDGSGVWVEGSVGMTHQMLHTTPESLNEKLPLKDREFVITADARIDNREELMECLGLTETSEIIADSELILKSYQKWGEKCPEKLLGDFAFAIWDGVENKLFCARDHMGVKPFYYHMSYQHFIFASEIKALLTIPELPLQINEEQLSNYLSFIYEDRKITSYNNIYRLPAACKMSISFHNSSLDKYWELNPDNEIMLESDQEYAQAFLDIFTEAVRCRLRSAFQVGSMLSGGLDSSSVTCAAQKILNKNEEYSLKTYSAIFETVPESDERFYINKVLESDNFDPYFIKADKISPLANMDDYLFFKDQPLILPNSFLSWNIYHEASKNGIRIVLDGLEGDDVVSHGDGFLSELARTIRWKKLLNEIKVRSKHMNVNPFRLMIPIILNLIIPNFIKSTTSVLRDYFRTESSHTRIIKPDFSKRMSLVKKLNNIHKDQLKIKDAKTQHYINLSSSMPQYTLEHIDSLSASFSIEARHPFYDKRLIEFCLAIPTEQKIWHGWDRVIMRRAMKNILPKEIQWRKGKADLSMNFHKSLKQNEMDLMDDILFNKIDVLEKYVDIKKLQKIYNQYKSRDTRKSVYRDTRDSIYIWSSITIFWWLNKMKFNKIKIKN